MRLVPLWTRASSTSSIVFLPWGFVFVQVQVLDLRGPCCYHWWCPWCCSAADAAADATPLAVSVTSSSCSGRPKYILSAELTRTRRYLNTINFIALNSKLFYPVPIAHCNTTAVRADVVPATWKSTRFYKCEGRI
mmetsp:Transcript_51868/g.89048  ORF Transcript_51868/g.89048 Transcript_51868/m.89048 type:complete len:135 (-) Transcript_51868:1368-1772(-)